MSKENKFDKNELPPEYLRIRPRVVADPHVPGKMWRVVHEIAEHNGQPRIEKLWEYGHIGQIISRERVEMWADLFANPTIPLDDGKVET